MIISNVSVPIITPFMPDFSLDLDSLRTYLQFLSSKGVRSIVVGGTTGESTSLTNAERTTLVNFVKTNFPDMQVLGGIVASDWPSANAMFDAFGQADALLIMPQPFIRPAEIDIRQFFNYITSKKFKKIILYNNPARLGTDISAMYKDLCDGNHIVGVKETIFDPKNPTETTPSITWWSGEDCCAIEAMNAGAKGLISALSNVLPDIALKIASKSQTEVDTARWAKWVGTVQGYRNPIGIKYLLYRMGLIKHYSMRFALMFPDMHALDNLVTNP